MLTLGYARLSSLEPEADLSAQLATLRGFGVTKVFVDREGPFGTRPALDECMAMLRAGDVFVVCRPDRLARKPTRFLKIEADLTRRGVSFVVLDFGGIGQLDTRQPAARQQLAAVAAVVRWQAAVARERQAVGIARAKERGVYKGRQTVIQTALVRELAIRQGLRPARVAALMHVSRSSVYRHLPPGFKVQPRPPHVPKHPIDTRTVRVLHDSGMKQVDIARQLGIHRDSVRRHCGGRKDRPIDDWR